MPDPTPDSDLTWDDIVALADALSKIANINASEQTIARLAEPLLVEITVSGDRLVRAAKAGA